MYVTMWKNQLQFEKKNPWQQLTKWLEKFDILPNFCRKIGIRSKIPYFPHFDTPYEIFFLKQTFWSKNVYFWSKNLNFGTSFGLTHFVRTYELENSVFQKGSLDENGSTEFSSNCGKLTNIHSKRRTKKHQLS